VAGSGAFLGVLCGEKFTADSTERPECSFCSLNPGRIILGNDLAFAIRDKFPVTHCHCLIVPRRHVASFFETTKDERFALLELLEQIQKQLVWELKPDGFNLGVNDGTAAGQTVMHLHIHLIPRYAGDTEDPRGGVRWVMPEMAPYWKNRGE
jgi:diadenosine tetraphosphate (Ap4A) HIT family hydrolase